MMKRNKKLIGALLAAGVVSWSGYSYAADDGSYLGLQDGYDAVATEGINIQQFLDDEFTANKIARGKTGDDYLRAINAQFAWARGFTGAGSKIVIIDSGVNDHNEFDKFSDYKNFVRRSRSREGQDTSIVGHGTGMASIAGANRDGVGVVGVAFDADIAVANVTDHRRGRIGMSQVRQAVQWAASIDADVVNISANTDYSRRYSRGWRQTEDGAWYNVDRTYVRNFYNGRRANGFYLNESPERWAKALGGADMVIVNSAGNGGVKFPENPASMAIATKDDGSLWLNGQMLIVGAWDVDKEQIARYSNRAGHYCQGKNLKGGQCLDEYRISDFFIMAPGNAFVANGSRDDLYRIQTGTSQAAAVVSGAVAVVRQAWPHMTAAETVTLLTETANRDIKGYDKEVHGMGLLDLEKATRPLGEVGIPTTGDRNGEKVAISGGFTSMAGDGLAELAESGLSSVMVTDELGRDYYVDLAQTANTKRRRAVEFNPITKANFYGNYNPYTQFNYYTDNQQVTAFTDMSKTTKFDMKFNNNEDLQVANFEGGLTTQFNDKASYRVGFGVMNEKDAFMGNMISGSFGQVEESYTTYMNFGGNYKLHDKVTAFGNFYTGVTTTGMRSEGLVTDVGDVSTYSWSAGLDLQATESSSFGATISQPVTIASGKVDVSIPVGLDANGNTAFSKTSVSMTPDVQEYDFGTYYKFADDVKVGRTNAKVGLTMYAEHQMNYLNQQGVDNNVAGFSLAFTW